MLYNVFMNGKIIDELEIPNNISKNKFRQGVMNFYTKKFKKSISYLRVDRLSKTNKYLIMGRGGELLFTIEEKKVTFLAKVWAFFNTDIRELF